MSSGIIATDLVLTDREGFVNLHRAFPAPNMTDPQSNRSLWTRAYAAAWYNDFYSALYYNITDDTNGTEGNPPFSYMNSALNNTLQLPYNPNTGNGDAIFLSLKTTMDFGDFTGVWGNTAEVLNGTNPAGGGLPSNPFNISYANFSEISNIYCGGSGFGGSNLANITNIFMLCGLIYGAPQRQDFGNNFVFECRSQWSQPLYTYASTLKATIKTVSLSYNGTEAPLENLVATNIQDKVYLGGQAPPLWGVENTSALGYEISEINLIWGLVSDEYANHPNVSMVRQNSLYLPGYYGDAILNVVSEDFVAGARAFLTAWEPPYDQIGGLPGSADPVDYTGTTDIAMLVRWQSLFKSAELVSQIPNLIWTDVAAAAVVGTKGVLGPGNTATQNIIPISITPTVSRVKYHWPYAIPALLAALVLLLITIAVITTVLSGHSNITRLRLHLQRLALGRIFTTLLNPDEHDGMTMKSKQWAKESGKTIVDLSGECPELVGAGVVGGHANPLTGFENKPSGPTHSSEEVEEHRSEEVNGPGHSQTDGQGVQRRFLGDPS